jgi:hypothetical protein
LLIISVLIAWVILILIPFLINLRLAAGPARQAARLALSTQLSIVFTAIAALSILAVMIVILWQVSTSQIQQIGQSFQTVAEFNAERVGNNLEQQIVLLKSLWYDQNLMYGINTANVKYGFAAFRPETLDELRARDLEWQAALESSDLVREYTLNQQAQVLAGFVASNPNHTDLIVTDKLGGLIAGTSRKPPHFFYGDEEWWQAAWNNGEGGVYLGDLQFDPQTGLATLLIAVVVKDPQTRGSGQDAEAGTTVGVLAATYNIGLIQSDFSTLATSSGGPIELLSPDGLLIASPHTPPGQPTWDSLRDAGLLTDLQTGWDFGADATGRQAVIAHFSIPPPSAT